MFGFSSGNDSESEEESSHQRVSRLIARADSTTLGADDSLTEPLLEAKNDNGNEGNDKGSDDDDEQTDVAASSLFTPATTDTDTDFINNKSSIIIADNNNDGSGSDINNTKKMTEEEGEGIGMYGDNLEDMTYSRRIARNLSKYDWYYPRRQGCDVSLDDGWAYFEHITLYRHTKKDPTIEQHEDDTGLDKTDPGEKRFPTQLYGFWSTPNDQLGDFGIGIGIYFSTTWWLGVITFIAGCISIPNIHYYYSDEYSEAESEQGDGLFVDASATCTDQILVPCVNCQEDDWSDDSARYIVATNTDNNGSNSEQVFVVHNDCLGAELEQGSVTLVAIVFLAVSLWVLGHYMQKAEVEFDEDEQTAQDYSLVVDDCPPDAMDPEEWRTYFSRVSNDNVTCVTVSIDNGALVNALVKHRDEKRRLKYLLLGVTKNAVDLDINRESDVPLLVESTPPTPCWKRPLQSLGIMADARSCYANIKKLNELIRKLAEKEYEATDIFVTFETEAGQRKALSSLSTGKLAIAMQKGGIDDDLKFRGDIMLDVSEPAEPSAVRWNDIATHWQRRLKGLVISTALTLVLLLLGAKFVLWRNDNGDPNFALYIAGMNCIFPLLTRAIVDYEVHADEGSRALSLYFKITLFRWVNTAIIIMASTPFTSTLGDEEDDLMPRIYKIFFAELISAPSIALVDVVGFFKKHYMAPRAMTQKEVNSNFRGTKYELAERYATVTKLLFLAFFYAALYPMGYFVCSAALFISYFTDKFCLLRVWMPAPQLGNEVAEFSREYFFPLVILALAIVNGYLYAMFPYDNVCATKSVAGMNYAGNYTYTATDSNDVEYVTVSEGDVLWKYCDQNILTKLKFPLTSDGVESDDSEWMTDEQGDVVDIMGWLAFAMLIVVVLLKYTWASMEYVMSWFKSSYEPSGVDQGINYSVVPSISAYVPQVVDDNFNFPLLACKVDSIDPKLIGWSDPLRTHDAWNLIHDFPNDLEEKARSEKQPILSIMKHYPPKTVS